MDGDSQITLIFAFQVLVGIALSWVLAGLTGFVPVFTGIYSDPSVLAEHQMSAEVDTTMTCDLVPNKVDNKNFWIFLGNCKFKTLISI